MADQVQWRGGSRENSDNFTGAPREVTVDTTDWILRVHDGIKPGGHKMMKVNDCLVVETADKCNPEHPSCKVTVNGELNVEGDTNLHDTVIDGNLIVNGNFVQDGLTIAVDTSEVILTNPGLWENPGGGCDLLPDTGNLRFQEDANQYISRALAALENAICSFDLAFIEEIQDIKVVIYLVLEIPEQMITGTVYKKNIIGIKSSMTFAHGMLALVSINE